jgi:hypothetical protein
MEASIVDLRYKMKDVLQSLDRNEIVKIYYHGKLKGIIQPAKTKDKQANKKKVQDHPFFGMSDNCESVNEIMDNLRGNRYDAL